MMAPSIPHGFIYSATDMCSSDVPGGVSTRRKSRSPQSTSQRNCLMRPAGGGDALSNFSRLSRVFSSGLHCIAFLKVPSCSACVI